MPPTRETYNILEQRKSHGMPELIFHVEPTKDHRFRYESEFKKGSHGRLKGRQTSENAKAKKNSLCPIVHLRNYTGPEPISLRVTFRTLDGLYQHANKVVMGSSGINAQPGVITKASTKLPDGTLEWRLDNISICYMGKKELETCLSQHYSTYSQMPGEEKKELENSGVLYAEALRHNEEQPFLSTKSEEIHNTKAMQCLNIDYVDKVAGYVTGNEEVVILCNKISKDLIDTSNLSASQVCVEFYDTKKEWRQFAKLNFIHHQVAIVFETPPYRDLEIDKEVEVWMQLRTKDDDDEDKCSEPKQFTYWPREDGYLARKRKKVDELERQPEYIVSQQAYSELLPMSGASIGGEPIDNIPSAVSTDVEQYPYMYQPNVGGNSDFADLLENLLTPSEGVLEDFQNIMRSDHDPMFNPGSQDLVQVTDTMQRIPLGDAQHEFPGIDQSSIDPELDEDFESYLSGFQVDSKTKGAKSTKPDESIGEADKPESASSVKDENQPASAPQTNGRTTTPTHPDKYMAYKLALNTAQCLHNFAKTGNVRILLMSMRHLVALQDRQGDNAIHAAVIHSQCEAMESLVEVARTVAEYDILNMCNELKESPLHIAVQTGQVKAIKLLLYHGATPNLKDRKGNTPIHLAAQSKNAECLSALLESKAYVTKYKKHAPDLNALNFSGFSALHLAILNDSLPAIKSLWYAGCDIDIRDRTSGRTALHFAVERHNLEIVHFLLHQAGAETDIHMFNGNTPLHLACSQNHTDTVAILMQARADPYLENYERAENSEDDSDSLDSAPLEDEDIRGLTSMDLAASEEIRSLLRGEMPLSSMSPSTMPVHEKEIEVPQVALHKGDLDKADPGTDSGIGLSGRGFSSNNPSSSSISASQAQKKLTLSDILDTPTQQRLAKLLDGPPDHYWKKVLLYLDMTAIEKSLANLISPTQGMFHYIQATDIELLVGILGALDLYSAKDVLMEATDKWAERREEEAYLDSKMRKMKL